MTKSEIKNLYAGYSEQLDELFDYYSVENDDDLDIEIKNAEDLQVPNSDFYMLPSEGYDYEDKVSGPEMVNLSSSKYLEIFGGPTCNLVKKEINNRTAFVLYKYGMEEREFILYVIE